MVKILKFYTYKNIVYKISVSFITILVLTFFFPKKNIFKYKFSKGKIWSYTDLFSPFNFIITKNNQDILLDTIKLKQNIYCNKNYNIIKQIKKKIKIFKKNKFFYKKIIKIIQIIYKYGYLNDKNFTINHNIYLIFYKNKKCWTSISYDKIYTFYKVKKLIKKTISGKKNQQFFLKKIILPNLFYNKNDTVKIIHKQIKYISNIKYFFKKGDKIIQKNDFIDENKFKILSFFKKEYEIKVWNKKKNYGLMFGYLIILSIIFFLLFLYLFYFQKKIFQNHKQINFLILNILLISFITIIILKYHYKILYLIPYCILPISIRAFFNFHLSFIIHIISILVLSFITPNHFDFIILQIITGFLVLLTTNKNIYKMSSLLFISLIKIPVIYIITFCSITLISKGSLENMYLYNFSLFFFNGILTLFIHPLIFIFEKLFDITSDLSLLELSNTNTPILRLLSKKAPGTLQHVLTVANMAEEAAVSIGANSLLVKIGAIYHDIGKIKNSIFFIENQQNLLNPHENISPKKSAKIILEHVSIGIKLAKKYHLPNPIMDFIRTHHGDSLIHYFYQKQKKKCPNMKIDKKSFTYSGPKPFSKETAIVMICDSIEAASKSIKNPSHTDLEKLVEKIINKQKKENQFSNTNITFKEIEQIKKVLQKKLINIYHTRIQYPK